MTRLITIILFLLTLPLYPILFILIKLSSSGQFIFKQKRLGKNKKAFIIYKFRTMVNNAEELKLKLAKQNEADEPAFKIRNDPRYTSIGKFLTRTAIDELPQLINIIRGEMAFVGPRPLPVSEAEKIPKRFEARFSVLPGLTSPWVIKGGHKLSFRQWMEFDCEYVKSKSIKYDLIIIIKTLFLLTKVLTSL